MITITEDFYKQVFQETRRMTTEEFVSRAKQLHPEYDYSKVDYINTATKVIITCPKHGDFLVTPNSFLAGAGCSKCSGKYKPTTEEFVSRAKQLHPEYDYSKVNYINNKTKVIMTCPKHGDFFVIPNNFLNGAGCPKCGDISSANKRVWDTDYFILRAKQIHPEYDYSKTDYIRAKQKVIVTCPKHGDFLIKPVELLCGHGCLKCAKDHLSDIFSSNTKEFISKAKQLHPEYDYSKVNYINSKVPVIISCLKHGDFSTTPNSFLRGSGCPRCSESKGERSIREWLENNSIDFDDQHRFQDFKKYPYDFYLPDYNIAIEFNGEQHYKKIENFFHKKPGSFEGQLVRDHLKKAYAERNSIELLVIPYWDFDNIDKILSEKLLKN